MGWAFLLAAFLIPTLNPRVYYLFPAFPMLLASGSVMWERWAAHWTLQWIKHAYIA